MTAKHHIWGRWDPDIRKLVRFLYNAQNAHVSPSFIILCGDAPRRTVTHRVRSERTLRRRPHQQQVKRFLPFRQQVENNWKCWIFGDKFNGLQQEVYLSNTMASSCLLLLRFCCVNLSLSACCIDSCWCGWGECELSVHDASWQDYWAELILTHQSSTIILPRCVVAAAAHVSVDDSCCCRWTVLDWLHAD